MSSGMRIADMFNSLTKNGGKNTKKIVKKNQDGKSKKLSNRKYKGGGDDVDVNWGNTKYRCTEINEVVKPQSSTSPASPAKTGGYENDIKIEHESSNNKMDTDITNALIKDIQESQTSSQTGGKTKRYVKNLSPKGQYKRYLEKMTLDKLQKMSKKYNIKITTKKNGKTVNIKKSSLVNKIVRIRYPSK